MLYSNYSVYKNPNRIQFTTYNVYSDAQTKHNQS